MSSTGTWSPKGWETLFYVPWGQFHQHSTRSFYVRKLRSQLFCAYVLSLYFTGARLLAQKLHVERWWNWPLVSSSSSSASIGFFWVTPQNARSWSHRRTNSPKHFCEERNSFLVFLSYICTLVYIRPFYFQRQ